MTLCNWHDRHHTCKDSLFLVSSDGLICHCIHAILNLKYVFIAELFDGEKKTLRSSQDLNLGLLNADQMLLPVASERRSDALTSGF